jgi:arsenate reductase-like glutaredoxin family protein
MQQQLQNERARVAKETDEVERTVRESRNTREWAEAVRVWPELKDQTTRKELVTWLKTEGYSDNEIDRIDSRDLKVIKRAFAHDKSQVVKETAAKAVLAKPRVVRPQARSTQPGNRTTAANDALSRLGKTGSVDDARAAIEALLG